MRKLHIDLPMDVRVVMRSDTKGNPVGVLEMFGQQVLFTDERTMVSRMYADDEYGEEAWTGFMQAVFLRVLRRLMLEEGNEDLVRWAAHSPTGREVRESEEHRT